MTQPPPTPPPPPDAILSARALRHVPGEPAFGFDLLPGTALCLEEAPDALLDDAPRWLDLLLGLVIPDPASCGQVLVRGRPWATLPPDDAASARGRFGTCPAGGGLLMNLDMDENVLLPALWHRRPSPPDTISPWATFFRCSPLPSARAGTLPPSLRRRIAWTRAFSGNPDAILLEDAASGAPPEDRALLLQACRRKLADGCALVWIAPSLDPDVAAALAPAAPRFPHPLPPPTERTP